MARAINELPPKTLDGIRSMFPPPTKPIKRERTNKQKPIPIINFMLPPVLNINLLLFNLLIYLCQI